MNSHPFQLFPSTTRIAAERIRTHAVFLGCPLDALSAHVELSGVKQAAKTDEPASCDLIVGRYHAEIMRIMRAWPTLPKRLRCHICDEAATRVIPHLISGPRGPVPFFQAHDPVVCGNPDCEQSVRRSAWARVTGRWLGCGIFKISPSGLRMEIARRRAADLSDTRSLLGYSYLLSANVVDRDTLVPVDRIQDESWHIDPTPAADALFARAVTAP